MCYPKKVMKLELLLSTHCTLSVANHLEFGLSLSKINVLLAISYHRLIKITHQCMYIIMETWNNYMIVLIISCTKYVYVVQLHHVTGMTM